MDLNIGVLSYITGALAFLFLTFSLLTGWQGRFQGVLLASASMVSAIWAGVTAYALSTGKFIPAWINALEILRNIAWITFFAGMFGISKNALIRSSRKFQFILLGLLGFCFAVLVVSIFIHSGNQELPRQIYFLTDIASRVVMAVAGMVLVEQVFRNTPVEQRWGVKFLCLGVGAIFAYDFFLYADAMLFWHIDANLWAARGVSNALMVPLIFVSAARNPQWSFDVHVSRRVVFHSAALLGAGVFLLVMAAAGYYIRVFGGNWGSVLQTAFLFGALVLLLLMFFSGAARARLKVFLSKHFFSYKYDYREEWLRFTQALSVGEAGARICESALKAIAGLVESPAGALWMRKDAGNYVRYAHWNLPVAEGVEAENSSLCAFLEKQQWVINLEEYKNTPDMYDDLTIPDWLLAIPRSWLIVPLILHERLLGFVLLTHSRSQVGFNWEVSDLLKTAGRQAASNLAQMQAAEALVVARQFESFNRMSAFVVHDLKNLIAQLSLMVANAEKHWNNPEFKDDMLSTVDNSVEKMNKLLAQLRSGKTEVTGRIQLDLAKLLEKVVQEKAMFKPLPVIEQTEPGLFVLADRERLLRVIGHIVQNASEATRYDGWVKIRLAQQGGCAMIAVQDNGKGMDEQFLRERLFRPFDTTKGSGMGIGAHECQEYIRELGGRIEVSSIVEQGTLFQIILPLNIKSESDIASSQGGGV